MKSVLMQCMFSLICFLITLQSVGMHRQFDIQSTILYTKGTNEQSHFFH